MTIVVGGEAIVVVEAEVVRQEIEEIMILIRSNPTHAQTN